MNLIPSLLRLKHQIPFKWMMSLVMLFALLWSAVDWLHKPQTLPIKHVRVKGELKHVSYQQITDTLSLLVQTGYFSMNTRAIVNALENLEWVQKASIRRIWPDTIALNLIEQQPLVVWNKKHLLNDEGQIFSPVLNDNLLKKPHLNGSDGQNQSVLQTYLTINKEVADIGVSITRLTLAEHGGWSLVLSNGIRVEVGHQNPVPLVIKGLRLLTSLEGERLNTVQKIDLRYPNGLAVAWKKNINTTEPAKG